MPEGQHTSGMHGDYHQGGITMPDMWADLPDQYEVKDHAERIDRAHQIIRRAAKRVGHDPEVETGYKQGEWGPEVYWDAGPNNWAVHTSMAFAAITGCLVEPGYGCTIVINNEPVPALVQVTAKELEDQLVAAYRYEYGE
jgi:hypothetical protein